MELRTVVHMTQYCVENGNNIFHSGPFVNTALQQGEK